MVFFCCDVSYDNLAPWAYLTYYFPYHYKYPKHERYVGFLSVSATVCSGLKYFGLVCN